MKVSIVGTGRVGATLAYTLLIRGIGSRLVLVDKQLELAAGEALDLEHAEAFTGHPMSVHAGGLEAAAESDVIVVTCSVPWRQGLETRFAIAADNAEIFREIIPPLAAGSPEACLLIVSNPVDVMTFLALQLSGFPPNRVFGTGTLLDSARFRTMLSADMGIHPDDLRAYILGEHGDTQFPVFSSAVAGGTRIVEDESTHKLFERASRCGFDVVNRKGHTNFAISMAAALVIESIAYDTRRTMPLSVLVDGFLGEHDVCLSLPVVVGKQGIARVLEPELKTSEQEAFHRCADIVRQAVKENLGM